MMNKTALITGSSLGFGLEFAKIFAREGYNLVLVARSLDKLNRLATEIRAQHNVEVTVFEMDLSRMDLIDQLYGELQARKIEIEVLVNNAGFGDFELFHQADYNKLENMIDLNVKALTKLSYLFVKPMVARGSGRILQVASTAAFQPGPTMAVYYATKAFVLSLGEAMSNELSGTGVTVTVLCPGASATGFQNAADLHESKLVKGRKLPTGAEIAEFGYKHLMKGSLTVIPGFKNKFGVFLTRLIPRKMMLKIVRSVQERA